MTINEVFKTLDSEQQAMLLDGLDTNTPHVVAIKDNTYFIAVHLKERPGYVVESTKGVWSIGRIEQ